MSLKSFLVVSTKTPIKMSVVAEGGME